MDRNAPEPERAAIEALHRKDVDASKRLDYATLRTVLSDDAVVLAPRARPVHGKDALDAMFSAAARESLGAEVFEYEMDWREVEVVGRFAFEWGTISGRMRAAAAAEVVREVYNVLRILRKEEDGGWRVYRTIWNDAPPTSS
jgi:ketosteroid isomerase-like protein